MDHDKKKPFCPKCNRASALNYIDDVIDGQNTFMTKCFCWYCDYVEQNYRKRTCRLTPKLPQHSRQLAVHAQIDQELSPIFRDLGICSFLDTYDFNRAFGDTIGYAAMKHKQPEILLPVMNTWNAVVGSLKVSRTGIRWPNKKSAMASILSDQYYSNYLFIVDNPLTALAIRYTIVHDNWNSVGVMVIKPGQTPPLKVLQTANDIFAFSTNEKQIEYIKKELPPFKTRLINNDLPANLKLSTNELKYYMVNTWTLEEKRKNDIKAKRRERRRRLKARIITGQSTPVKSTGMAISA